MIPDKNPYNNWNGNGSTTTFDFDFYIEDETQLAVYHTNSKGVQTLLKYGTDYSINELQNENGSFINFPLASSTYSVLSENEVISLCLTLPITQENPYSKSSYLNLETLEYSLDYLTRICQIISRQMERSVKTQEGSSQTAEELVQALNDAQVNAAASASEAAASANAANASAIAAGEEATIATQKTAEVSETYNNAMADIQSKHSDAVLNIQNELQIAEDTILADRTEAVEGIATAKVQAINECENEVVKAKRYAEQSGGKGMPTDICKRLNIEYDLVNRKVKLKWIDPNDTINSYGQILSSWSGTIITCKENSYPENYDDGILVLNSKVRNQYGNAEFIYDVPQNISDITTLKFRAFPYSTNDVYNKDTRNCFDETFIYEFLYDSKNSNTKGCITKPIGCMNENFTPAKMDYDKNKFDYGSWKNTFIMDLVRPCMLYNQNAKDAEGNSLCGQVMEYLDPEDYSKTIDGNSSHIADESCNANAMAQWDVSRLWFKIVEYLPKKYHCYVANKKVDNNYKNFLQYDCDGNIKKYYYNTMFDACIINGVARSLSGKAPAVNATGDVQLAAAQANGKGYDASEERFIVARNILLMLMSETTDAQTAFGTGRQSGGSNQSYNQLASGQLNDKGGFHGDNNNGCVKVFHSENPWGNVWKILQGFILVNGVVYLKFTPNTNDGSTATAYNKTGSGYINTGITISGTSGGYISSIALAGDYAFVPTVVSGSSSTFIPDGCWFNNSIIGFARFGCCSADGLLVGAFTLHLTYVLSDSCWFFGLSLSYS
mgnify:FL=1